MCRVVFSPFYMHFSFRAVISDEGSKRKTKTHAIQKIRYEEKKQCRGIVTYKRHILKLKCMAFVLVKAHNTYNSIDLLALIKLHSRCKYLKMSTVKINEMIKPNISNAHWWFKASSWMFFHWKMNESNVQIGKIETVPKRGWLGRRKKDKG